MWSNASVAPGTTQPIHQRQFLSALALILIPSALVVGVLVLPHWLNPAAPNETFTYQAGWLVLVSTTLVYALNRLGHYNLAAPLFVFELLLAPAWAGRDDPQMLVFMFVGVLVAMAVLSLRGAVIAGAAAGVGHLVIFLDPQRGWNDLAFPLCVNGIQIALVLVARSAHQDLERRRLAALLESERWFATTLSSIGDAVLTADIAGRVSFMNPVACELTGWTEDEARGHPVQEVFQIINEYTGAPARSPVDRVLAERKVVGLANHTILISRDGTERPIADSGAPIVNEGELMGVVLVFRDQSQERALQERMDRSSRLESLGRLAGGVAHDFNNLLTVIGGGLSLVLGSNQATPALRQDLQDVSNATQRAVGLTRQLLAFSRRQVLQPRVLDINKTVSDVARIVRRLLTGQSIQAGGTEVILKTELEADAGHVLVDPVQLEQVITNLAINGADAMPKGGELTLRTDAIQLETEEIPPLPAGSYVRLRVSDTGTGMDKATLDRAFEPFFSTKPPGRGTGLGLATVHGIVQQSGGVVQIETALGKGTTFTVILPTNKGDVAPVSVRPPEMVPAVTSSAQTILLVEDDPQVRKFAQRVLDALGYTTLAAGSGAEALRVMIDNPGAVQLLITDIVMPEMTGPEVAEAARAQDPNLPVLFVSGYADEVVARDGMPASEGLFLEKPFTPAALAAKVRAALDAT